MELKERGFHLNSSMKFKVSVNSQLDFMKNAIRSGVTHPLLTNHTGAFLAFFSSQEEFSLGYVRFLQETTETAHVE
jgi:hypothetical protein